MLESVVKLRPLVEQNRKKYECAFDPKAFIYEIFFQFNAVSLIVLKSAIKKWTGFNENCFSFKIDLLEVLLEIC